MEFSDIFITKLALKLCLLVLCAWCTWWLVTKRKIYPLKESLLGFWLPYAAYFAVLVTLFFVV